MKKLLVILLAMALLVFVGCASENASGAEGPDSSEEPVYETVPFEELPLMQRLPGDWYAEYEGLLITLSFTEDGAWTLRFPGRETQSGSWALADGRLTLDGIADGTLFPVGSTLRWDSAGLLFEREKPEIYEPAALRTGIRAGDLDGYWKSRFVAVGGGTMRSSALGENTDIYIQGTRAALGGPLFGDVIVDTELKDGALTYAAEGVTVQLALQEDGFLRLTMSSGEEPVTLYLFPAPAGAEEGPQS